jgi:hypothetical protein
MGPYLEGSNATGETRACIIIVTDPGDRQQVAAKPGKPGISILLVVPVFPATFKITFEKTVHAPSGTFANDFAHSVVQQVHRLQTDSSIVFQWVAS